MHWITFLLNYNLQSLLRVILLTKNKFHKYCVTFELYIQRFGHIKFSFKHFRIISVKLIVKKNYATCISKFVYHKNYSDMHIAVFVIATSRFTADVFSVVCLLPFKCRLINWMWMSYKVLLWVHYIINDFKVTLDATTRMKPWGKRYH